MTIECLDRINIESADCIINLYESKMHPGKVSGYLRKLNVIQTKESDFGGKYDEWDTPEVNSELQKANEDLAMMDDPANPLGK